MSSSSAPQPDAGSPATKYVVVTGGVISGVGKGIMASSVGVLLKSLGQRVTAIKIDPYLNIDAGTLSPNDHGEVFVLGDGGETDLDLGNYERFLDVTLGRENSITTGKIYAGVIERERRGDYLGKTVQVVPHITNAIQDAIAAAAALPVDGSGLAPTVCVVELGGTVGEIETAPFVEALRQFQFRVGRENFLLIHVTLVPLIGASAEQKTKPTQMSVASLRGCGLTPDVIACRSVTPLEQPTLDKISLFCQVPTSHIFGVHDCRSVYHVPLLLETQHMRQLLCKRLALVGFGGSAEAPAATPDYVRWKELAHNLTAPVAAVSIAIVGKYTILEESYTSVVKSLNHAAMALSLDVTILWIEASDLEEPSAASCAAQESPASPASPRDKPAERHEAAWRKLHAADGIIVPGGFGTRGTEGKLATLKYAREAKKAILGICLGFQLAVIEHARNVLGMAGANSTELDADTPHPVIVFMPEGSKTQMGGTMRLGARTSYFVTERCASRDLYSEFLGVPNVASIAERHRHRYEVNPALIDDLEHGGLTFVAKDETGKRMEILERSDHPYFVAVQYHPEFLSRLINPSPLFVGLLRASTNKA